MKSLDPVMKGSSNIIRYFIVTRNIFFLIRAGLKWHWVHLNFVYYCKEMVSPDVQL